MKERPIIFSGAMARAILDDRKSQTRRTAGLRYVNEDPGAWVLVGHGVMLGRYAATFEHRETGEHHTAFCPYGIPGDRLWVRETWRQETFPASGSAPLTHYRADQTGEHAAWTIARMWRSSIFMPRALSRVTLENTDVRVERVQDISEDDARAEGVTRELRGPRTYPGRHAARSHETYRDAYMRLWDMLNAKRGYGWAVNPWVWPVSFRRLDNEVPA